MTIPPEPTGHEQADTRFRPGQSGNPAGRPAGSRNRVLAALDAVGEEAATAILQAAIGRAKDGDMQAAALILGRVWPARKGRAVAVPLPTVTRATDLPAALGAVVDAMGRGEISAEEAAAMAAVLEGQRRAIETADLEARLAAVEAQQERGR